MARRQVAVEATVVLAQDDEQKWRIRLQFDGGEWFMSDQKFDSRGDAEAAFYRWRAEVGAETITAQ